MNGLFEIVVCHISFKFFDFHLLVIPGGGSLVPCISQQRQVIVLIICDKTTGHA